MKCRKKKRLRFGGGSVRSNATVVLPWLRCCYSPPHPPYELNSNHRGGGEEGIAVPVLNKASMQSRSFITHMSTCGPQTDMWTEGRGWRTPCDWLCACKGVRLGFFVSVIKHTHTQHPVPSRKADFLRGWLLS